MTIKRSDFLHLDNGDIIKKSEVATIRLLNPVGVYPFYQVQITGNCYASLKYSSLEEAEDCLIRLKQQLFVPSEQENKDES